MSETGDYLPFQILEPPEMFPRLPALAQRLGVKPNTGTTESGRTVIQMKNGDQYDLFDLMNAFLDKVEAAERLYGRSD